MAGRIARLVQAGVLVVVASDVQAADLPSRVNPPPPPVIATPAFTFVQEVRFGVSAHQVEGPESTSVAIGAEILSAKLIRPANPLVDLLIPQIHVGGSINTVGDTSFAYAGFTWSYNFTPRIWGEMAFGGAIHNGETGDIDIPSDRAALGCSPLFRESFGLGYRLSENWSVLATIEHLSNAGLCDRNRGLTNIGARIGYRF